jgi:hypothetical protein
MAKKKGKTTPQKKVLKGSVRRQKKKRRRTILDELTDVAEEMLPQYAADIADRAVTTLGDRMEEIRIIRRRNEIMRQEGNNIERARERMIDEGIWPEAVDYIPGLRNPAAPEPEAPPIAPPEPPPRQPPIRGRGGKRGGAGRPRRGEHTEDWWNRNPTGQT